MSFWVAEFMRLVGMQYTQRGHESSMRIPHILPCPSLIWILCDILNKKPINTCLNFVSHTSKVLTKEERSWE
jgi:hypothetical protein